jgi:malate dehydrogenase
VRTCPSPKFHCEGEPDLGAQLAKRAGGSGQNIQGRTPLLNRLAPRTREAGTEIVKFFGKGSAFFSPAWSAIVIAESNLKDKRPILPCAALCEGEYGVKGVFIGVPIMVSGKGMEKVYEITLNDEVKAIPQ